MPRAHLTLTIRPIGRRAIRVMTPVFDYPDSAGGFALLKAALRAGTRAIIQQLELKKKFEKQEARGR